MVEYKWQNLRGHERGKTNAALEGTVWRRSVVLKGGMEVALGIISRLVEGGWGAAGGIRTKEDILSYRRSHQGKLRTHGK